MKNKIKGFHIDMNIARFRYDYLKRWLLRLSNLGYNTILWEIENNIKWESCPECVAKDAFSKHEFNELLDYCESLGLESIPVLQTLGHCEYVIKHKQYEHLAEIPGRLDQYCPLHPHLQDFLKKWINEYLTVFTYSKRFHIGADEAWSLGKCPKCKKYVERNSLSELYINHINSVSTFLLKKDIQPVIWADMVLHHPEALDVLNKDVMLFDFMYDAFRGSGQIWVWDKKCDFGSSGLKTKAQLDDWTIKQFGKYLLPNGSSELETFYTADYLSDKGFEVVTCPSSCSYPDNIFAPRTMLHMKNTFDSFYKGQTENLYGSVLTSWTMHLLPWELQTTAIEIPDFFTKNPNSSLQDYLNFYSENHFGVTDNSFFSACELLSNGCLFTHHPDLGFDKKGFRVQDNHIEKIGNNLKKSGQIQSELENCAARIREYEEALEIFKKLEKTISKGADEIKYWILAAENLILRAKFSISFISDNLQLCTLDKKLEILKQRTNDVYYDKLKPSCVDDFMHWTYYPFEKHLSQLVNLETTSK